MTSQSTSITSDPSSEQVENKTDKPVLEVITNVIVVSRTIKKPRKQQ